MRVERLAAGIADLNDMTLRYEPPVSTKRDPWWKLLWAGMWFVIASLAGLSLLLMVA